MSIIFQKEKIIEFKKNYDLKNFFKNFNECEQSKNYQINPKFNFKCILCLLIPNGSFQTFNSVSTEFSGFANVTINRFFKSCFRST